MDDIPLIINIEELENQENARQRHHRFEQEDPFEVLNEVEFIQIFRLSKGLCHFLIESLEPYMRPQRRNTDLSISIRVMNQFCVILVFLIHYLI